MRAGALARRRSRGLPWRRAEEAGIAEAARGTRSETLARLQSHLQRLNYELQMGVAQRCRGWTPQT